MGFEQIPASQEKREFSVEAAREKERSILERFRNSRKVRNLVGSMMLMSALACGKKEDRYTPEVQTDTKVEHVVREEAPAPTPEVRRSAADSSWAKDLPADAREELREVEGEKPEDQKEAAEWWARDHYNSLVKEFYLPEGANTREVYGIQIRVYDEEQSKRMLEEAQAMKQALEHLNSQYGGIDAYQKRIEQLDDMIMKLERENTYAAGKQRETLEKAYETLDKIGYNRR